MDNETVGRRRIKFFCAALLRSIKKNARARGLAVEINARDILELFDNSDLRCTISNIDFDFSKLDTESRCRPFAPSIDRINSKRGYTKDNIRLVCFAVNYAMSDWGLPVLERIAQGITRSRWAIVKSKKNLGLPGVTVRKRKKKGVIYEAIVGHQGKRIYLGAFATEVEAHRRFCEEKGKYQRRVSSKPPMDAAQINAEN